MSFFISIQDISVRESTLSSLAKLEFIAIWMGQINGDMIALMTFHKNLILEAFIPRILWQKKMKMIIIIIIIK